MFRPHCILGEEMEGRLSATPGFRQATTALDRPMIKFPPIPLIFTLLALLFLFLALMDVRKHGSKTTPARKVWLRIGLIFAAVSLYLLLFQAHFP